MHRQTIQRAVVVAIHYLHSRSSSSTHQRLCRRSFASCASKLSHHERARLNPYVLSKALFKIYFIHNGKYILHILTYSVLRIGTFTILNAADARDRCIMKSVAIYLNNKIFLKLERFFLFFKKILHQLFCCIGDGFLYSENSLSYLKI